MKGKMDENRIDQFFKSEYKKLVHYVQKNTEKRYADAYPEDIVQDVALNLLDKLNVDLQIENLAGYIYRSLRNKIFDTQKKKRLETSIENFVDKKNENALNNSIANETDENNILNEFEPKQLREAIEKLNEEDKYIITASHFERKSFQQLSEELNTTIGTLLSRKHRAQVKLGKILISTQSN